MRIKWARITTSFLTVALSAAALTGCSREATAPATDGERLALDRKVQELQARYGWIGEYHTEGLEFVYRELNRNRGRMTQREYCRVIARAVKDFHRQARRGEVPFEHVDPALADETCGREMRDERIGMNILTGRPRVARDELSPLAVSYMDQIDQAINSATTASQLYSLLVNIQYAAVGSLNSEEAGAVVAVVSVALSSMSYWETNLDKWMAFTQETAYSREPGSSSISAASSVRTNWWSNPFNQGFRKVLSADALGGARVIYTTWRLGPIGWDAAAAAALFSSVVMAGALLF